MILAFRSQPKCHRILKEDVVSCFVRQAIATNPTVFKLQVSLHVIPEGEGHQTIHTATALRQLLISPVVINGDTLHKAVFAPAHVDEGGAYMPLSRVLAVHLLLAAFHFRRRAQSSVASVPCAGAGRGAAVEVPKGLRVFRDADEGLERGLVVPAAGEGQRPLAVQFPRALLHVEGEGGRGGAVLGTDEVDGSIGLHGVGGDVQPVEWLDWELLPRQIARFLRRPDRGRCQMSSRP
ncbi:hypothetical protein SEVIR_9G497701v4 [Setaria viridis]